MITKLPRKRANPRVLLDYLGGKQDEHRRFLATNMNGETPKQLAAELELFSSSMRPALHDFTKHMVLSFAPGEELPDEQLRAIVTHYLERMGYGECPYAAYVHTDTPHPHLHIVTTPTSYRGERVNESWDWPRSERVAREIERVWGLREVELSDTAKRSRASPEEYHAVKRTGEVSLRGFVIEEISAAAHQAKSFREFARRMEQRGFTISIQVNAERELKGISFAYGDIAFTGSQLGRAFRGSNFLTAYAIEKPTAQDVERYRAPLAKRDQPILQPAASTSSESLSMPAKAYLLALVSAAEVGEHALKIDPEQVKGRRPALTEADLQAQKQELSEINRKFSLLVRPFDDRDQIAFRAISAQNLARLRRDGLEPAMVVKIGEHFDVALHLGERLELAEASDLRKAIAARYGLEAPMGIFPNAVRLPGYEAVPGRPETLAQLVATREGPMPAAEGLLREHRRDDVLKTIAYYARDAERSFNARLIAPAYEVQAQWLLDDLERSRQAIAREPRDDALASYRHALQALAAHGAGRPFEELRQETLLERQRESFRMQLETVAMGANDPVSLRRLNAELLIRLPERSLPVSLPSPDRTGAQIEERLRAVGREIRTLAQEAAGAAQPNEQTLARLFARSFEALELHQQQERALRRLRGVVDPGPAPQGISQTAWDAGWLQLAVKKGFDPYQAANHLANATRTPFSWSSRSLEQALSLTTLALQHGLYAMYGYARRVLSQ